MVTLRGDDPVVIKLMKQLSKHLKDEPGFIYWSKRLDEGHVVPRTLNEILAGQKKKEISRLAATRGSEDQSSDDTDYSVRERPSTFFRRVLAKLRSP
jgi:hypothetical protein